MFVGLEFHVTPLFVQFLDVDIGGDEREPLLFGEEGVAALLPTCCQMVLTTSCDFTHFKFVLKILIIIINIENQFLIHI